MKRLWNDKLIVAALVLNVINFWGSAYNGELFEAIVESLIYFLPGFIILLLLKPVLRPITKNRAIAFGIIYALSIGFATVSLTRIIMQFDALILLACFTYRVLSGRKLLKEVDKIG